MTTSTDHIIQAFIEDGGYASVEEWAQDSDFRYVEESGEWYSADDNGPWASPVDIYGAIEGAIEASGFVA
jgi:hypothetical protein